MEHSLVILKPDTVERGLIGAIISRLEAVGLQIVASKIVAATDDQINKHYQLDNDDYCTSIGCKSESIAPISFQDAITNLGVDRATELRDKGKSVLGWNKDYMKRKPLFVMVIQGVGAITRIRSIVGATNPPNASPGTIRFDFGIDSIERANAEKRGAENLVHASGTGDEALSEMQIWFSDLNL